MSRDDGGPAFPCQQVRDLVTDGAGGPPLRQVAMWSGGMTLREWFAGQAPPPPQWWTDQQGRIETQHRRDDDRYVAKDRLQLAAMWPFQWADAMLAERRKEADDE